MIILKVKKAGLCPLFKNTILGKQSEEINLSSPSIFKFMNKAATKWKSKNYE